MLRLSHNRDAGWFQLFHQDVSDLTGEPSLKLQPPRVDLHNPGKLADAHDATPRNVADVEVPVKGQKVVLTEREEGDITHDDHLLVVLLEPDLENLPRVL